MTKKCKNCGAEYESAFMANNQKYCPDCTDIMRRQKQKEYKQANKQEEKTKRRKKKFTGGNFNDLTRKAKELGISYGKLQALIYTGTLEDFIERQQQEAKEH